MQYIPQIPLGDGGLRVAHHRHLQLHTRDTRVGGDQAEEVRQRVHSGRVHVHAVLLLAAQQVPAVRQP